MKNIVKKIAIFSMVGMMQIGLGASIIEASPLYNEPAPMQQQNNWRVGHGDRFEHDRQQRERAENERHEREMKRRPHETRKQWHERQKHENERHERELREIRGHR
jgi:membrane protein involved in colicin uptake